MKAPTKIALSAVLLMAAADAMADGGPHVVTWLVAGGLGGFLLGFLAGLWWCKRHHKHSDQGGHGNGR